MKEANEAAALEAKSKKNNTEEEERRREGRIGTEAYGRYERVSL